MCDKSILAQVGGVIVLYSQDDESHYFIRDCRMRNKRFALFAWSVLGWNLLVILWGAYVRATGSGAGCGRHWPLCNGEVFPRAPGEEMVVEFTHRLLSGVDILLVTVMLVWGLRIAAAGQPLRKGLIASGFFLGLESLLGAGLVLFELTTSNSSMARAIAVALHLANTFLLIASLTLTAYWASGGKPIQVEARSGKAWLLGAGLLGMILIGMSGAVTALGDTLFPAGSLIEGIAQELDANAHFLIRLRVYHPILAVLIAVYSLYMVRILYGKTQGLARNLLLALTAAGCLQLAAGLINLILLAPIFMQIIHLLTADLTWMLYISTAAAMLAKE